MTWLVSDQLIFSNWSAYWVWTQLCPAHIALAAGLESRPLSRPTALVACYAASWQLPHQLAGDSFQEAPSAR